MDVLHGKTTRRTVIAGALGGAASLALLQMGRVAAQPATPVAGPPQGYVVVRIHTLESADARTEIDPLVASQFVPIVQRVPGYVGYINADSVDNPRVTFTLSWFATEASTAASTQAAASWVSTLPAKFQAPPPVTLDGPVGVAASPTASGTLAAASPAATPGPAGAYIAIRSYRSQPGFDVAAMAPTVMNGFVPIIQRVAGFRGYLWVPLPHGRFSVSIYDSKASADESTAQAAVWVKQQPAGYTAGKPTVYDGQVVFADVMKFGLKVH